MSVVPFFCLFQGERKGKGLNTSIPVVVNIMLPSFRSDQWQARFLPTSVGISLVGYGNLQYCILLNKFTQSFSD